MSVFSPSVNLERDSDQDLLYIPTANARRIYEQLLADYGVGIHAFSIIGSYGTGKSAFLLALQRTLNGDARYFAPPNGHLGEIKGVEFFNIVGSYASIRVALGERLGVLPIEDLIFERLAGLHDEAAAQDMGVALVIDEFGKFLEYAAQHEPEQELYFIQKLAEFINDPDRNLLLITVLHQNFSTYGSGLNSKQREEWEKVKGRLKELTFNEPVEQLLELAASFTESRQVETANGSLDALVEAIDISAAFPHRGRLTSDFARRLLPFDLLSISVLTQALQRYGQNDRSLFTFLQTNDYLGINSYNAEEHPYYNLVCVYDYLAHNYESVLNSVQNPHYAQWGVIRRTQERAEAELSGELLPAALKLIKVIGLLTIFAPDGAQVNPVFLERYGESALGLTGVREVLTELEDRQQIRYIRFKDSFVLFEGTDLNIELELTEAEGRIDPNGSMTPLLREHFEFPLILAKAASFQTGTPRFFRFLLSDEPTEETPDGLTDGIINLVFAESDESLEEVFEHSSAHRAVLYAIFHNAGTIRQTLFEIQKIGAVLGANQDDRVASRELERLKSEQIDILNRQTIESLYEDLSVKWVWDGKPYEIRDARELNGLLSTLCDAIYSETPKFHNELVNKHRVSSAISTARRYFFEAVDQNWDEPDLGFAPKRFPAQKSIYLTLLKETGIHRNVGERFGLFEPTEPTFQNLWRTCESFLDSAKTTPKEVNQLMELLGRPPFKLKAGLIDFWVPTFLFAKREEFALYYNGVYAPVISADTLILMQKEPRNFRIKSFAVDGIRLSFFNRFRQFVQQEPSERISNTGFIETIRPFLTFYKSLPPFSQQTTQLDPKTIRLREVIAKATDPEKAFFEEFPLALGFEALARGEADDGEIESFVEELQCSVRELRTSYERLVDRIEEYLFDIFGIEGVEFPAYRSQIETRFSALRPNEMLPRQRMLLMRLASQLDDRDAWLNSVVQAVVGRDIRRLRDEDVEIVYSKLRVAVQELDNLCELDELHADLEREAPPVALELTTTQSGRQKLLHRLPKQKEPAVSELKERLQRQLSEDESVNAGALIRLLQEMLSDE